MSIPLASPKSLALALLLSAASIVHAGPTYRLNVAIPGGVNVQGSPPTPGEGAGEGGGPGTPETPTTPGPAQLQFAEAFDFGRVPYLKKTTKAFTLKAVGGTAPAVFDTAPVVKGNLVPTHFVLKDTDCTGSLESGQTCVFHLEINASFTSPMAGTMTWTVGAGADAATKVIPLTATPFKEVEIEAGVLIPAPKGQPLSYDLKKHVRLNMENPDPSKVVVSITGALPEGVTFDASTGQLRGSPTKSGEQTFTLKGDYLGQVASGALTLKVSSEDLTGVQDIAVGDSHGCLVLANGTVRCWGSNTGGQLGDPTLLNTAKENIPREVPGLTNVRSIVAVDRFTCALTNAGQVQCWGSLPPLNSAAKKSPIVPAGFESGVSKIVAGFGSMCAVVNGGVTCLANSWEPISSQFLFSGTVTDIFMSGRSSTYCVTGLFVGTECVGGDALMKVEPSASGETWPTDALFFAGSIKGQGSTQNACVLDIGGKVFCNKYVNVDQTYTPVGLGSGVTQLVAGYNSFCALQGGKAMCWGPNGNSETGRAERFHDPLPVPGLTGTVTKVTLGSFTGCAVMANGTAACWGSGMKGEGTSSTAFGAVLVQK